MILDIFSDCKQKLGRTYENLYNQRKIAGTMRREGRRKALNQLQNRGFKWGSS